MSQPSDDDQQPWDALPPELPVAAPPTPPPPADAPRPAPPPPPPPPSPPPPLRSASHRPGPATAPPAPSAPWWRAAWALVAAGVALGLIIGVPSGAAVKSARPGETQTATVVRTTKAAPETRVRTSTVTVTVSPTASTPNAVILPGTFLVNTQIPPGTYQTQEPDCYWERLSGTTGDFDDIITNDITKGPGIVTIAATDVAFNSDCSWARI